MLPLLLPMIVAAGFQQTPLDGAGALAPDAPGAEAPGTAMPGTEAQLFVALVDDAGGKAIFLASANSISVYMPPDFTMPRRIALPADAAYVDVADLDGDGAAELIVVAGRDVYAASLNREAPLRARGSVPSVATAPSRGPVPTYLAHRVNEGIEVRVPTGSGLERLAIVRDGNDYALTTPATAVEDDAAAGTADAPVESDAAAGVSAVDAAAAGVMDTIGADAVGLVAVTPPQVAPADGAEFVLRPYAEIAVAPGEDAVQYQRSGTVAQARDAADRPAEDWPWFYLHGGSEGGRALYALDPPDFDRTLVRVVDAAAGAAGPARLYPGAIVPPREQAPDFNGDGWTDLLLWRAPAPTFSLSSLTRWAQSGRWSLDLMTHLFDPDTMRYDARPAAVLRTRVPLVGFLEPEAGLPVSLWTAGDFDGDGQDDLLLKTEPRRLDVWLHRDGFAEEPDAALRFPAPVTAIEFAGPLAEDGPTVLAVRTQDGRHLVWYEE